MKSLPNFVAFLIALSLIPTALAGSPAINLRVGSSGDFVAQVQTYLHNNISADFYNGGLDGQFGPLTATGLMRWQKNNGYPATGSVEMGSYQWLKLVSQATVSRLPKGIDLRAIAGAKRDGWSVDANKTTRMLYLLHKDPSTQQVVVALASPTSFAGCNPDGCFFTPEGAFPVCRKAGADEVSHEWHNAPMAWAVYMRIGGYCSGTAVHQDPLANSHRCIHVPDMAKAEYINQHMPIGALIVIHR